MLSGSPTNSLYYRSSWVRVRKGKVCNDTKSCRSSKAGCRLDMTEQLHWLRLRESLPLSEDSDAARSRISGSANTRYILSACAMIFYSDPCYLFLSKGFLAVFPPGLAEDKTGAAINSCLASALLWHQQCWGNGCPALWVKFRFPTTSLFSTKTVTLIPTKQLQKFSAAS